MQGGRATHRIASSSRCLLSGTQTQHAQASRSVFTPTRCYTTPAEGSTPPANSSDNTWRTRRSFNTAGLTGLHKKIKELAEFGESIELSLKGEGTETGDGRPVSLKSYRPATGVDADFSFLFPKRKPPNPSPWRPKSTLTPTRAHGGAAAGQRAQWEAGAGSTQRPPWKGGLYTSTLSRSGTRLMLLRPRSHKPKSRFHPMGPIAKQEESKDLWRNPSAVPQTPGSRSRWPGFTPGPLVVETQWAKEPWADAIEDLRARTLPPHITPANQLAEGVIGAGGGLLIDVAPKSKHQPVATLAHGLERVLFNPGVHWLRDPRSRVYNFTPWLEEIPKVDDFAFERLSGFVKSSRDQDLRTLAVEENRKFAGSTSSMSGMLGHIYFLLSEHKDVETETLSQHFAHEPSTFTMGQRSPAAVVLNYKDGHYAIDSYNGKDDEDNKNVLTWLGTLLENFLTKPPQEFKTFLREESAPIKPDEEPMREAYRYAKSDKIVMRSQLDCHDSKLPGTGVFDLKTRACVSIRQDILNYEENAGYMIKSQHGLFESFEREYYDLIRSAFLKYSFQVRIGNMDGVMVAYHNTERIYGFQYISLDEMDERLFGAVPGIGDKVFGKCVGVLEAILEEASKLFPEQSILCYFETPTAARSGETVMEVFVEPQDWDEKMGPKPVEQLSVSVAHLLDGEEVKSRAALRSTDEQWTVKYEIDRATLPLEVIRSTLDLLVQRKFSFSNRFLPSHIEPEDADEYWAGLSFGTKPSEDIDEMMLSSKRPTDEGSRTEEEEGFEWSGTSQSNGIDIESDVREVLGNVRRKALFASPTRAVKRYRKMSRQGRLEYEKMKEAEKGKPKILLGHGVYTGEGSSLPETATEQTSSPSLFSRIFGRFKR